MKLKVDSKPGLVLVIIIAVVLGVLFGVMLINNRKAAADKNFIDSQKTLLEVKAQEANNEINEYVNTPSNVITDKAISNEVVSS
ncbi:MAG: hypothetical protein IKN74_04120 [Clostridia bacterium]|nr:hypothetical protein [Clostridia bacterium]